MLAKTRDHKSDLRGHKPEHLYVRCLDQWKLNHRHRCEGEKILVLSIEPLTELLPFIWLLSSHYTTREKDSGGASSSQKTSRTGSTVIGGHLTSTQKALECIQRREGRGKARK